MCVCVCVCVCVFFVCFFSFALGMFLRCVGQFHTYTKKVLKVLSTDKGKKQEGLIFDNQGESFKAAASSYTLHLQNLQNASERCDDTVRMAKKTEANTTSLR